MHLYYVQNTGRLIEDISRAASFSITATMIGKVIVIFHYLVVTKLACCHYKRLSSIYLWLRQTMRSTGSLISYATRVGHFFLDTLCNCWSIEIGRLCALILIELCAYIWRKCMSDPLGTGRCPGFQSMENFLRHLVPLSKVRLSSDFLCFR